MRVTFDSNAWERIFDPADQEWIAIRLALANGKISGFISEAAFRIEAIPKRERESYFSVPAMDVQFPFTYVLRDGKPYLHVMAFGPDDRKHPGLPDVQSQKLENALASGLRVLRGLAWLGLPSPPQTRNPMIFAEDLTNGSMREERQIDAAARIEARGLGKAMFDAAGGWQRRPGSLRDEKVLRKACAEWADAELVAAHIGYGNDILCTDDRARSAGVSIFDPTNRAWLISEFGVNFATLRELNDRVEI